MRMRSVLSSLLIASALSLMVGGYLLYVNSLVPMILVDTTIIAVVALFILSYFVAKGIMLAVNIATILGVISPILSFSTPAHVGVLEQIASGGLISVLGLLQLLGFYVFPILFVILRIVFRSKVNN